MDEKRDKRRRWPTDGKADGMRLQGDFWWVAEAALPGGGASCTQLYGGPMT